jgi:hypothetical protein
MRVLATMAALAAVCLPIVGCSDTGEMLAVEISQEQGHESALPFTVTGAAAAEGAVCAAGAVEVDRLESMEGDPITDEDWAQMFDAAMETQQVAEMYVYQVYTCDDASGDFTLRWHNRIDFATFEFEGRQDVGTWEVDHGSGNFEELAGSGDITLDWEADQAVLAGEVRTG